MTGGGGLDAGDVRERAEARVTDDLLDAHVAELLISRPVFPRSLAFCYEQITQHLDAIQAQDPLLAADARRQAHVMHAQLRFARIDQVIEDGLHEYLTDVVDRTRELGTRIAKGHLF